MTPPHELPQRTETTRCLLCVVYRHADPDIALCEAYDCQCACHPRRRPKWWAVSLTDASTDHGRALVQMTRAALFKARRRARKDKEPLFPSPVATDGTAELFDPVELRNWAEVIRVRGVGLGRLARRHLRRHRWRRGLKRAVNRRGARGGAS